MKKVVATTIFVILAALVIGGTAVAVLVSPSENLTYNERDVDHDNEGIYENYVVWDTSYNEWDVDSDVFLYDLENPLAGATNISDDGACYAPNIDGDRIVYTHDTGEGYEIRMYTISDETDTMLVGGLSGWEEWPDISGDKVVFRTWNDSEEEDQIYYLNLADETPVPVQISPTGIQCNRLAISGNYVVFEGMYGDEEEGLFLKDLSQMGVDAWEIAHEFCYLPNIDGTKVVYEYDNWGTTEEEVYLYDIVTDETTKINTVDEEEASEPDIQGNNIVYAAEGDLEPDEWVTFYNLATGYRTIISDPDNYCCPDEPAVYGNNVLYLDHWDTEDESYPDSVYHVKLTPTFDTVPGLSGPINITEGQIISSNPYLIKVFPTGGSEITRVEFYIDGILIGTLYAPNAEGVWEWPWDTTLYHSLVRVVAYDATGESVELTRNTTVTLPYTGI